MMKVINPRRAAAGRKGGLATKEKHGQEYFIALGYRYGVLGGRPRALTYENIRLNAPNFGKGERLPTGLVSLKKALEHKENLMKGGLRFNGIGC